MLGGQGADRITGGDGDDDLIGGHNVAGGSDAGDFIDGGAGNDWIAGDNADLLRTGTPPRARASACCSATAIYDALGHRPGRPAARQLDPNAANEERPVHAVRPQRGRRPPGTFGDDVIAGGADDDVIFGQLGDDWIQGDGSAIDDNGAITVDVRRRPASRSRTGPGSTATGATTSRATAATTRSSAASARTT